MTTDQREKCHLIIHGASTAAAGVAAGLAQLPCADAALIVPTQIAMVVAIGRVFGVHISDSVGKGLVTSMAGMWLGKGIVSVAIGWVPFLGNAVNAATAAGITEAMGWIVADKFDQGEIK